VGGFGPQRGRNFWTLSRKRHSGRHYDVDETKARLLASVCALAVDMRLRVNSVDIKAILEFMDQSLLINITKI